MMSKLYFRYGAMNSGKTTALLQVAHNYEEKGMHPIIIKPSIDTKGANKVTSRIGIEREVDYLITPDYNIEVNINLVGVDAIIVDEAQFLTREQVEQLYRITKYYSVPVLCYGLRCDFQMQGFPGSTRLLEIADSLEELKTICSCGKKATQNLRLVNNKPVFEGEQISIDNQDEIKYDSVCGDCYLKLRGEIKNV
jgi:thymidine kinase